MNWLKLIDPLNRVLFNEDLEDIMSNCADLGCDKFCRHMVKVASKLVKKVEAKGWFEPSKEMMCPILEEKKRLLIEAKSTQGII